MPELVLYGCRPEPLSLYLQALGILRVVGAQKDPDARGHWHGDTFVLTTRLDADDLIEFFVDEYEPTPVVSPWNGGSGFKAEGNAGAVEVLGRIEHSESPRLATYRTAISSAHDMSELAQHHDWDKETFVQVCRNHLPDAALEWVDAAIVLTTDGPAYPPLLGSGGNDGRLDFSKAYMDRVADVFCLRVGRNEPTIADGREWIRGALFGDAGTLLRDTIGQFDPGSAGGPNSSPLGSAVSLVNPWTFVLLVEGALLFAAGAARRMGSQSSARAAMPFTFNATTAGYGTAASEKSRGELWAPLWSKPASAGEMRALMAEGRVEWRGRQARVALDAARGARALGANRGIEHFARHGFLERNGLATAAVSLGRISTREESGVELTAQLDPWLDRVRRGGRRPANVDSAFGLLERRLLEHALRPTPALLQTLLGAVSRLELAIARANRFRSEGRVPPVFGLDASKWLAQLDDGSPEFDLARSWASARDRGATMRTFVREVRVAGVRHEFSETAPIVAGLGARSIAAVLADVLVVRARTAPRATPFPRQVAVSLDAIELWLDADLDDARTESLLEALLVLDYANAPDSVDADRIRVGTSRSDVATLPSSFALLAPCYALSFEGQVRAEPQWAVKLAANDVAGTLHGATRRLRAARRVSMLRSLDVVARAGPSGPRIAAALLARIPLARHRQMLERISTAPAINPL